MSTDPTGQATEQRAHAGYAQDQPSEEELRAAYEAELSRITSADMILQAAVSILNLGGRRLGRPGRASAGEPGEAPPEPVAAGGSERDLEQVRDSIDAVRALLEILERRLPAELGPLRDALSQLQMAYAREVQASAAETRPGASGAADGASAGDAQGETAQPAGAAAARQAPAGPSDDDASPGGTKGPGPAEASGRLWVPGR
jgi:hypothetical protein